jgi:cyclopropane fatty-acyl-phospholipid synthase-like methyltransferase
MDFSEVSQEDLNFPKEYPFCYSHSGGPFLDFVLRNLSITQDDCAIDIGCGKGAVILTLARYPLSIVDGIEISENLASIARKNFRKVKNNKSIIFCIDAMYFHDYDKYTHVYMFNPFPGNVVAKVMKYLELSLMKRPRLVTIIYTHPCFSDEITKSGRFKLVKVVNHFPHKCHIYEGI